MGAQSWHVCPKQISMPFHFYGNRDVSLSVMTIIWSWRYLSLLLHISSLIFFMWLLKAVYTCEMLILLQGAISSSNWWRNGHPFWHSWLNSAVREASTGGTSHLLPASSAATQLGEAAKWGMFLPHMAASQLGAVAALKPGCIFTPHIHFSFSVVAGVALPPNASIPGICLPCSSSCMPLLWISL